MLDRQAHVNGRIEAINERQKKVENNDADALSDFVEYTSPLCVA